MNDREDWNAKRELIGCGLLYWVPLGLLLYIATFLGDCFDAERCSTDWQGVGGFLLAALVVFAIAMYLRLSLGRSDDV